MQSIFKWLGTRLFSKQPEDDLYDTNPRLRVVPLPKLQARDSLPEPQPTIEEMTLVDLDTELGGRIEDAGPGKNVLIRNKYLREDTGTHETLKIIDESIIDTGEEAGFDPYNTGQFDRSRNWKSRTRE